jgi:hypothetical protein
MDMDGHIPVYTTGYVISETAKIPLLQVLTTATHQSVTAASAKALSTYTAHLFSRIIGFSQQHFAPAPASNTVHSTPSDTLI